MIEKFIHLGQETWSSTPQEVDKRGGGAIKSWSAAGGSGMCKWSTAMILDW